jgi:hypothetical protein
VSSAIVASSSSSSSSSSSRTQHIAHTTYTITLSTTTPPLSPSQQRLNNISAIAHRKQHTRSHITRASHRPPQTQHITTNSIHQRGTRNTTNRSYHYYLRAVSSAIVAPSSSSVSSRTQHIAHTTYTVTLSTTATSRAHHTAHHTHNILQHTRNNITRASHHPQQHITTTNSIHQRGTRSDTHRSNHYLRPVIRHRRVVVIIVIAHTPHRPHNIHRHTQRHNTIVTVTATP